MGIEVGAGLRVLGRRAFVHCGAYGIIRGRSAFGWSGLRVLGTSYVRVLGVFGHEGSRVFGP